MTAKKRLLVAEDDPAFRRVIQFTLERAGFEVTTVSDGGAAIDALRNSEYDYLITDHQMPCIGGIEVIRAARQEMQLWDLPIVLCTAKGLEIDAEALAGEFTLTRVIHKPFSPRELVKVIRTSWSPIDTAGA